MAQAEIIAVCISKNKGTPKRNVGSGKLVEGRGLENDAHAGDWHRQVSLLAIEQIETMKEKGLDIPPGGFAENLTTQGFDLDSVIVGSRLTIGESVVLEITQIGKECHTRCAIYHTVGDCIMPKQGVFAKVITGGEVKVGDSIQRSQ